MSHVDVQDIYTEAMALSTSERASLAHNLILSLDDPADFELSPRQEQEIQRRVHMVREGKAKNHPADTVFADIKAKYK
ncbi:MAG: addiction module antitoxin RelB [Kiritimatiellae bacterium]|nr:addiction module antitoxin RelB [Kiritimatiellia bacterium]